MLKQGYVKIQPKMLKQLNLIVYVKHDIVINVQNYIKLNKNAIEKIVHNEENVLKD